MKKEFWQMKETGQVGETSREGHYRLVKSCRATSSRKMPKILSYVMEGLESSEAKVFET